ncbi:MAG: DNA repair exonuclease, partial [Brucellaceae bacterium]|nr:DNA repair exonuclease [Brucellaceae bacterium]
QGRDINEAGAKSVTLVTIDDSGSVQTEERLTSIAQFERVTADVSACEDWRAVIASVQAVLEAKRETTMSEQLVARLHLTGTTALAWQMRRDHDLLLAEAEDKAAQTGDCWIEKLEIDCTPPRNIRKDETSPAHDPLQELGRLIKDDLAASPIFHSNLAEQMDALVKKLPSELRNAFGGDETQAQALITDLLQKGSDDVLAELSAAAQAEEQA